MGLVVVVVLALLAGVALLLLAFVAVAVRRRVLVRGGGTFDCSLRRSTDPPGKGWMLGIARYTGDSIEWFRVFSFSPRPQYEVARRDLTVVGRRPPSAAEAFALLGGAVVVECRAAGRPLELALNEAALTGLLSWLEAAPPGSDLHVA